MRYRTGPKGFEEFFTRIEKHRKSKTAKWQWRWKGSTVAPAVGCMVRGRGYRLYNINNLKLARFKEIFPGAAKSDRIDARKGLELFQLSDHLPLAKEVCRK